MFNVKNMPFSVTIYNLVKYINKIQYPNRIVMSTHKIEVGYYLLVESGPCEILIYSKTKLPNFLKRNFISLKRTGSIVYFRTLCHH